MTYKLTSRDTLCINSPPNVILENYYGGSSVLRRQFCLNECFEDRSLHNFQICEQISGVLRALRFGASDVSAPNLTK